MCCLSSRPLRLQLQRTVMAAKLADSVGLINVDKASIPPGYASVNLATADGSGFLGWQFSRCGVRTSFLLWIQILLTHVLDHFPSRFQVWASKQFSRIMQSRRNS
jgi:hypothetical protein